MDVLLIPGLWLDGSAWADVATLVGDLGHRPHPLTLPGQGDGDGDATYEDQVAAVVAAIDAVDGDVIVVGHSAASTLAWVATDARPDRVRATVLVGGFPSQDGETYADLFESIDGGMPFPGWEPFEGPDADDLDVDARRRLTDRAVTVPAAVAKGTVRLRDPRRFDVPVVLVCPEYSPAQAEEWIEGGDVPELAQADKVEFVDIDSGHWPMFSRPEELARILVAIADAH